MANFKMEMNHQSQGNLYLLKSYSNPYSNFVKTKMNKTNG